MNKLVNWYKSVPTRGKVALNSVLLLFLSGTVFYHYAEGWTWIQSLYFTTITLTTIGYGDFAPTTDFTRLVTVVFVIFGVSTIATFLSLLGSRKLDKREARLFGKK